MLHCLVHQQAAWHRPLAAAVPHSSPRFAPAEHQLLVQGRLVALARLLQVAGGVVLSCHLQAGFLDIRTQKMCWRSTAAVPKGPSAQTHGCPCATSAAAVAFSWARAGLWQIVRDLGYADNVGLLATTPDRLQCLIDAASVCEHAGMHISANKTRLWHSSLVVVFLPGPYEWHCTEAARAWVQAH